MMKNKAQKRDFFKKFTYNAIFFKLSVFKLHLQH